MRTLQIRAMCHFMTQFPVSPSFPLQIFPTAPILQMVGQKSQLLETVRHLRSDGRHMPILEDSLFVESLRRSELLPEERMAEILRRANPAVAPEAFAQALVDRRLLR